MQLRMRVSGDMAAELERAEECRRKDKHDAHNLLTKFQKEAAERYDRFVGLAFGKLYSRFPPKPDFEFCC